MMLSFIGNFGGLDLLVGGCCCFGVLAVGVGIGLGIMLLMKKKNGK